MSDLYVSRPSVVEAIQWLGTPEAIEQSVFGGVIEFDAAGDLELLAGKDGAQGWVPVPLGHWLVRNPGDPSDNWPVDADYFAGKYEYERRPRPGNPG